jgi:phage shock protein PspC (stress-responsive transcriptional regulator)
MVGAAGFAQDVGMESSGPPDEPGPGASGAQQTSTAPPPPRPGSGSLHELRRSRHDRMLGGVAAGIARNYGWDPMIVRLAFVVASVFGIGIPVYVVAWIVIPNEPDDGTEPAPRETGALIGLILLGVGVLWLGSWLVPSGDVADVIWPLTLIGGGFAVLYMRACRTDDGAPGDPGDPSEPGDPAVAVTEPVPAATAGTVQTAPGAAAPAVAAPTTSAWAPAAHWPSAPPAHTPRPRPPRPARPRSYLTPLTLSVVTVFAGIVALLAMFDAVEVDLEVVGAIVLGLFGVALVVSARYGRAGGLIPFAILLTLALSVVAIIDAPLTGGIGERDYEPSSVAEVDDEYRLAIGSMTLDLRDVRFTSEPTEVTASVGIGRLEVLVPTDARVDVHAEAGAGRVVTFGESDGGTGIVRDDTTGTSRTRVLRLDVRTGIGETSVSVAPRPDRVPSEREVLR